MTTLLDLKTRKADLRNQMDVERKAKGVVSVETFSDYGDILRKLKVADDQLLNRSDAFGSVDGLIG